MSTASEHEDFAGLLRRHRISAGLSQEELAEKAGLSADAVAALERGRRRAPRPLTVRMLATALSLDNGDWAQFIESLRRSDGGDHPRMQGPPLQTDSLIGRSTELAETTAMLTHGQVRLLTLTGMGGVGKTRLAIAVAAAVRQSFATGVCWVSLADRPDGTEVVDAVGSALGLRNSADTDEGDLLAEHIGGREMMLVLDNCEHVVSTCADLCVSLLQRCPHLTILVTSRELLRIPGEVVRHVHPLAVPPSRAAEPEQIHGAAAVRLFLARAAAHGVEPPEDRMVHVSRVCRQVQGIPLAIELAAARVNVLTIEQIADELVSSSRILSGGNRTAHRRQQTIEAALDWSYDLLDPQEQRFFEAVSIFAGGWTFESAQAVCDTGNPTRGRILDLTGRLIDKSLITVDREGTEARYGMYMVIRQYAEHRLDDSGLRPEVEQRHQRHFVEVAEQAEAELESGDQRKALSRLDAELDNIRVALGRAVGHGHGHEAVRLSSALWRYFYLRGNYAEGRDWLESALQVAGSDPEPEHVGSHAKALRGIGYLAFLQCDYDEATTTLEKALALYRHIGDEDGYALVLRHLGSIARERADYDRAFALHHESLAGYSARSNATGEAWSRHHLGFVCWLRGDFVKGREFASAALDHFQRLGEDEGTTWAKIDLGSIALYTGDLDTAEGLLHRSLARSQRMGYREGIAWSLNQLGVVALQQGRLERAIHLLDESLAEHQELGDRWRSASVLEAIATVAERRGDAAYAAFVLGAAGAVRKTIGVPVPTCERPATDATLQAVRAALDRKTFDQNWGAGQVTPLHAVADSYPPPSLRTPVDPAG